MLMFVYRSTVSTLVNSLFWGFFMNIDFVIGQSLIARTYEFHNTLLTWSDAVRDCRNRGGMLATIHYLGTIPELQFDTKPVSNVLFWTGLSEQEANKWTWADGSEPNWSNWAPAETSEGRCAAASLVYQYYWRKEDCSLTFPYVCQYETGVCNFSRTPESSIAGHNNKMVFDKSPEECQVICVETTSFECRSFEYNTQFRYCQLSSGNQWTLLGYMRNNDKAHDYYHRRCNTGVFVATPLVISSSTTSILSSSMAPSPGSSILETSSYDHVYFTSIWISTPVLDISTTKLIICTEYNPGLLTSSWFPSTTIIDLIATTLAPVQKAIVELEKSFEVVKEKARQKTKVSIEDPRPSAQTVGYAAGIIMFSILGAIILLDLGSLFRDVKMMKSNLKARSKTKPSKVVLTFDKEGFQRNLNGQRNSEKYIKSNEATMDKSSEPEPDYDRPSSEVYQRPHIPRPHMFGRPTISEHAFSFSLRQAPENLYEVPT